MIKSLAYVGVNSPRAEDWRRFGTGFLGGELAPDGPDGAVRLRVDDAAWRLEIRPAEQDSVAFFGWQVDHEEDLDVIVGKLAAAGVTAERGSRELADERNVDRLDHVHRPVGLPARGDLGSAPLPLDASGPGRASSGFVTGNQGLGHILLLMPDIEAGHEFFSGVLGLRALRQDHRAGSAELAVLPRQQAPPHARARAVPARRRRASTT